jgi:hypothetical protein
MCQGDVLLGTLAIGKAYEDSSFKYLFQYKRMIDYVKIDCIKDMCSKGSLFNL